MVPRHLPPAGAARQAPVRVSVRQELADGIYVEGARYHARCGAARLQVDGLGGIGSLRGRAQCAERRAARLRRRSALVIDPRRDPAGLRSFPGPRASHGRSRPGRQDVLFINDSKATNADSAAQALACFTTFSGSPAANRRPAASNRCAAYFPRIRKAYLIGEAAGEFAATLGTTCPTKWPARSTTRSQRPRAMRQHRRRPSRSCSFRPPAPRSTSTAISRCAATHSGRWCRRCRGRDGGNEPSTVPIGGCRALLEQGDGSGLARRNSPLADHP